MKFPALAVPVALLVALLVAGLVAVPLAGLLAAAPPDSTLPPPAAGAGTPPDPALLARARAAAGEIAVIDAVRGFRVKGEYLPLPDGATSRCRVTLDLRSAMREEISGAEGTQRSWRSGRLAWAASPKGPRSLTGDEARAVHLRYFALCAPLLVARAPADSCSSLGTTPEGWVRLVLRVEGGLRVRCDVEPDTGRVRRVGDAEAPANDPGVEWELDDFRSADGIVWPHRLTRLEGGRAVGETVWERFERADDLEPKDLLPGRMQSDL